MGRTMATEKSPLLSETASPGGFEEREAGGEMANGNVVFSSARTTYDPHATFETLLKWKGTIMPNILARPALWLSFAVFVATTICRHEYPGSCGKYLPELVVGDIAGTLLPLMTFYLAFFTSECYSRYKEQYTNLKMIEGSMRNIGIMATNSFDHEDESLR